ncbi:hypothetical protein FRC07_001894, partial [Ceratobasidium sp. 392]
TGVNEPQRRDQTQDLSSRPPFQPTTSPPVTNIHLSLLPPATSASPLAAASSTDTRLASAAQANVLLNPNIKRRFAIGPRSNCERCLSGEPGHYGHWL